MVQLSGTPPLPETALRQTGLRSAGPPGHGEWWVSYPCGSVFIGDVAPASQRIVAAMDLDTVLGRIALDSRSLAPRAGSEHFAAPGWGRLASFADTCATRSAICPTSNLTCAQPS